MLREADVLRLSTDGEDQSPLIKPSDHLSPHERGIINDLPVHLTVLKDYVDGLRDFKLPFETSVNEPMCTCASFSAIIAAKMTSAGICSA